MYSYTPKKIFILIAAVIYSILFMNFTYQNKETIIFSLTYWNKDLVLIPIVIIKDSKLFKPPVIYNGRLNVECISFIEKYYKLGQTYYKANNGIPNEVVSINEEVMHSKFFVPEFCYQPIYAKVFYLGFETPSNCLITNSLAFANDYTSKKNVGNRLKKVILNKFIENYKTDALHKLSYLVDDAIEFKYNNKKNLLIALFSVISNNDNKTRRYFTIFEKNKNGYDIVLKDSLYNYTQDNDIELIEKKFIDVVDLESDQNNELVFYYKNKDTFGFQIYKKLGKEWIIIYEINYGC